MPPKGVAADDSGALRTIEAMPGVSIASGSEAPTSPSFKLVHRMLGGTSAIDVVVVVVVASVSVASAVVDAFFARRRLMDGGRGRLEFVADDSSVPRQR